MLGFIKSLFSNKKQNKDLGIQVSDEENNFINSTMEEVLFQELDKRDYFKKEHSLKIKNHIFSKIDLNKGNEYLSNEEKEKLGISKRLKVSKDLIEIFDNEKIKDKNPKKLLSNLFNQVRNKALLINSIRKYKDSGFEYVKLLNARGERSCNWCKNNDGKKIKIDDAIDLINKNCKCEFIGATFIVDI